MKHIHETWAFLIKSQILGTSVSNVYGSQNEFIEVSQEYSFCAGAFLGKIALFRRNTIFAVGSIEELILKKYIFLD